MYNRFIESLIIVRSINYYAGTDAADSESVFSLASSAFTFAFPSGFELPRYPPVACWG